MASTPLCAHPAVGFSIFKLHPKRGSAQAGEPSSNARGENQNRESEKPARPEARRRRCWWPQALGLGVPGLARLGIQGDRCAGNTVHSVPGGTKRASEGTSRKDCGSGSGSPPGRRSAYIETDRFAYLSHSQPAREASLYILTKHSALQNVSYALADQPVHSCVSRAMSAGPCQPGHL